MSSLLTRANWGALGPPPGTGLDRGHPLAQGLLLAYPLNEMGGSLVHNYGSGIGSTSSQRFPGTFTGPVWEYGARISSSTNYITLSNVASSRIVNPVPDSGTFSCWHNNKQGTWSANSCPFFTGAASGVYQLGITIWSGTSQLIGGMVYPANDRRVLVTASSYMALNRWHHIAVTYTPTETYLYVDGRIVGSNSYAATYASSNLSGYEFYSGVGSSSLVQSMAALVKNLRFYNRALTPAEIQQLYSDPWAGYQLPRSPLHLLGHTGSTIIRPSTFVGSRQRCW